MTDLERTVAFFASLEIEVEPKEVEQRSYGKSRNVIQFTLDAKSQPRNKEWDDFTHQEDAGFRIAGYSGFYTTFVFALDGSFIEMGIWE
jgi:hypothetical protein